MFKVKDLERGKEMEGDVCWGQLKQEGYGKP